MNNSVPFPKDAASAALLAAGDIAFDWDMLRQEIIWAGETRGILPDLANHNAAAFTDRIHPEDAARVAEARLNLRAHNRLLDIEYRLRQDDGSEVWVHERSRAEFGYLGDLIRVRGVVRSITQKKVKEAQLEHQAHFDPLTGRPNRTHLIQTLEEVCHKQPQQHLAYFAIGIDNMAVISDAIGSSATDIVLTGFAQRLERCLQKLNERGQPLLGRVAGDVFGAVLFTEQPLEQLAQAIIESFRTLPIETPVCPIHLNVSIGGVDWPQSADTAIDTMVRAEQALAEARRLGVNSFVAFRPSEMRRQSQRRTLQLGEMIQRALKLGGLELAYQPIVRAGDSAVSYYEALMRLRDEDGQLMLARDFMPAVEQLGLTRQIDQMAFGLAWRELAARPDLRLAINISGLTACDVDWRKYMQTHLAARPDLARRLVIEITETHAIDDLTETVRFVGMVRECGGRVALDDFGAGFTALRHIRALAIEILKIDGSLVRDVVHSPDQQVLVRTLVTLAKGLGLITVAECVEDTATAQWLRAEGVDMLQGQLYGMPAALPPKASAPAATPLVPEGVSTLTRA